MDGLAWGGEELRDITKVPGAPITGTGAGGEAEVACGVGGLYTAGGWGVVLRITALGFAI